MIQKKVNSINFEFMSPETIRKMSAVRTITPDTYDDDGYPIEGGLMDLRLGVIDPGLKCRTCGHRMITCPGHFGHIELVRPVLHIGYIKMIYMLLRATCDKCGRILIPEDKVEDFRKVLLDEETEDIDVLEEIKKTRKLSKCPYCKTKQVKIKLLKPTTFFNETKQRVLPSKIRERLERIPEEDLKLLGVNSHAIRPEWSVITALPVPPAALRPSITLETGERSEDDLTHKLVDILRINQRLADNISAGAPQLIIEDLWDLLQYHVTTYFNNEVSGIPPARHRSGRPLRTLFQRLKGKEGRFRYHLSGKRVNFSARTVLSPDPNIDIGEVGVPQIVAEELTIPVSVTNENLKTMKKLMKNESYPKVNYIIRPDGRRKKVTPLNRDEIIEELAPEYIVERQLINGDISFFNRQPSLHKHSMMSHKVKILPGKTFRLNDAVSNPYNADYDGDEMNLHVPQTEEARIECDSIMKVRNQMLSIRHGRPIISGQLDHVSGIYLITKKGTVFDRETAIWLLVNSGVDASEMPVKKEYTGKELVSQIIPKDISISYISKKRAGKDTEKMKEKDPNEAFVKIEKGNLICGTLDKEALGGKLMKKIFMQCGAEVAEDFLNKVTKFALNGIMLTGLTMGISDNDITTEARKEIRKILKGAENEVDDYLELYKKGKLERVPGKTKKETLEDLIMAILSRARNTCGDIAIKELWHSNSVIMATTGAKGKLVNVTQISGCLGQTALRGQRILRGYTHMSLPHFKAYDDSAKARGFIESSFLDGLKPGEYFFHSISGRDSLVDKGIRTGISGYMQRRLVNALIDITLRADGTVRAPEGDIVQFQYGEDGANPTFCFKDNAINVKKYFRCK